LNYLGSKPKRKFKNVKKRKKNQKTKYFNKNREKMMKFLESLNNKKKNWSKNKSPMKFKRWSVKNKMKIKKKWNKSKSKKWIFNKKKYPINLSKLELSKKLILNRTYCSIVSFNSLSIKLSASYNQAYQPFNFQKLHKISCRFQQRIL
jgi:hypothetical protein